MRPRKQRQPPRRGPKTRQHVQGADATQVGCAQADSAEAAGGGERAFPGGSALDGRNEEEEVRRLQQGRVADRPLRCCRRCGGAEACRQAEARPARRHSRRERIERARHDGGSCGCGCCGCCCGGGGGAADDAGDAAARRAAGPRAVRLPSGGRRAQRGRRGAHGGARGVGAQARLARHSPSHCWHP